MECPVTPLPPETTKIGMELLSIFFMILNSISITNIMIDRNYINSIIDTIIKKHETGQRKVIE